jgi:hypothetical protein
MNKENQSQTVAGTTAYVPLALLLFVALVVALAVVRQRPPAAVGADAPPDVFSSGRAMQHLKAIAQRPHPLGSAAHDEVRDYLVKTIEEYGLQPEIQRAAMARKAQNGASVADVQNVIAKLPGAEPDGKDLVLSAHYDSVTNSFGASDDGAGVAALLETLRALKAGPRLKRDVVFLFTDGEENGLLGAKAFVEQHPLAKDAGLFLNFEARGSGGPAFMFETSQGNGWVVEEFDRAAEHPFASSFMYDVYRLMPNDTDMTVFKRSGASGLNFAYLGGAAHYHTNRDSVETIEEGSVQHHGSYALGLARHFGNLSLEKTKAADGVYFDLLGATLLTYSGFWILPLAALALLAFVAVAALGLRRGLVSVKGTLSGFAVFLLSVVVSAALVTGISWALRKLNSDYNSQNNATLYMAGFVAVALAVASGLYLLLGRRVGWNNLSLGALLGWLALAALSAFYLPGGSYLFTWPLLFALAGLAFAFSVGGEGGWRGVAAHCVGTLPGLLLLSATTYLIFLGLGLSVPGAVVALTVLLLGLLVPLLQHFGDGRAWLLPGVSLLAAAAFLLAASFKPIHGNDNPRANSISYRLNVDTGQAVWESFDRKPDEWTAQFLSERPEGLALTDAKGLTGKAPSMDLRPVEVSVVGDVSDPALGLRRLRLRVTPPRGARVVSLALNPESEVVSAVVNGQKLDNAADSSKDPERRGWFLNYTAPPQEGFDLSLDLKPSPQVTLTTTGISDGLPEVPGVTFKPRPAYLMPAQGSDTSRVTRTIPLGEGGESKAQAGP